MGIKLSGYVNVTYIKTEAVDDVDDRNESGQRKGKPKEYLDQLDATDFSLKVAANPSVTKRTELGHARLCSKLLAMAMR